MMETLTEYQALLVDFEPRPIRSKAAYQKALRRIEHLMSKPKLGREESELVELLATLIEQYESLEHPAPGSKPAETLEHLIETREITRAQLAREIGMPRSAITNILARRRSISKALAVKLSKYFQVPISLFIEGA
ncbi:MAG: helix-turn-helix domain-containing protein [Planctomycetes bacterium]|nr:helix-turn-helix domain-containing protein [Planctomycetota bacterium]